jgi:ATP-dependent helicase/nuclease subunit B
LVKAFWRPQLQRFARWFAATEPGRRMGIARILTEVNGALPVGGDFTLTARADRIDVGDTGSVVIYDYKTGKLPGQKHVEDFYAPQLSLEGAIAEGGGFEGVEKARWTASSISMPGSMTVARARRQGDASALAKEALVARRTDCTLSRSEHALRGEAPRPFARAYDYDDYGVSPRAADARGRGGFQMSAQSTEEADRNQARA